MLNLFKIYLVSRSSLHIHCNKLLSYHGRLSCDIFFQYPFLGRPGFFKSAINLFQCITPCSAEQGGASLIGYRGCIVRLYQNQGQDGNPLGRFFPAYRRRKRGAFPRTSHGACGRGSQTASSPSATPVFSATTRARTAISPSTRSRPRSCGSFSSFFWKV